MGTQIFVSSALVHALTREAVASFPELTDRAPLALVVDALLMRAADDVWDAERIGTCVPGKRASPPKEGGNLTPLLKLLLPATHCSIAFQSGDDDA